MAQFLHNIFRILSIPGLQKNQHITYFQIFINILLSVIPDLNIYYIAVDIPFSRQKPQPIGKFRCKLLSIFPTVADKIQNVITVKRRQCLCNDFSCKYMCYCPYIVFQRIPILFPASHIKTLSVRNWFRRSPALWFCFHCHWPYPALDIIIFSKQF